MKKMITKILAVFILLGLSIGCQEDDAVFGDINSPNGLQVQANIVGKDNANPDGDGSGLINFTATATDAINYKYIFSDGTTVNAPSGILQKRFTKTGKNTYTVTVLANGKAGVTSSISFEVTVFSDFKDDQAVQFLTGGTSKKWYWAANEAGHLGVGPNNDDAAKNFYPDYYAAPPFDKAGSPNTSCIYDNVLTFSLENDVLKMEQDNGGRTFFNAAFLSEAGGSGPDDLCLPYNTGGKKTVQLSPSESILMTTNPTKTRGTAMTFTDNGFMGYYIKQTTYEILSLTENRMIVRAVMGGNSALAWYHTFTATKPTQGGGNENFTNLVWSDEFDTNGAPDPTKWSYNIGTGTNGWGNNEAQYYTNTAENAIVEGGVLKIIAKKQTLNGSNYTSARLVSENKFEFKYGKIEFRAKLPTGGGTWPALWMLGENYATNPWPACGEIDVMEHKGNEPNKIHGSLHYPGNFGGNANTNTTTITNASTAFHTYAVIWSASSIKFYVDDTLYHSYANVANSPFNLNFFLIMNVAMGGTFGGNIDPAFTQSAMEVDYVRVYQ